MPVPWGSRGLTRCSDPEVCEKVENRAMTLRQLRDMRAFIRRLAKVGLLQRTSEAGQGTTIRWTEVNMVVIKCEILLKLIPTEEGCSWVEIVASAPQRPTHFISHNWAEPFRDFMSSVELHAGDHGLTDFDTYWICTFANSQFKVELGHYLEECPFLRAMKLARSTVLMLDKSAGALRRSWCTFELELTTVEFKLPLEICTPSGMVGSSRASSGNIIEAVRSIDVRKAEASFATDRRQIMNRIAKVPEMTGLVTAGDGTKALDPEAMGECADAEDRKRVGAPAYQYEVDLVGEHAAKFEDVNRRVRQGVEAMIGHESYAGGYEVPNVAHRGMTLTQYRAVAQKVLGRCSCWPASGRDAPPVSWETVNLHHVVEHFIVPVTYNQNLSYMELCSSKPQPPAVMVSHFWGTEFKTTIAALEWHAEARHLPDSTSYWMCAFANNQHDTTCFLDIDPMASVFTEVVFESSYVFAISDRGARQAFTRVWSILECFLCCEWRKTLDIGCETGVLATTRPFQAEGEWEFGHFDAEVAFRLMRFQVTEVKASIPSDRPKILGIIAGLPKEQYLQPGIDPANDPANEEAFARFNHRIRLRAVGPALRNATASDELAAVRRVLQATPDLCMCSPHLRGVSGETALHLAAGRGSLEMVQYLLQKHLDPNAQDNNGETPLHYAALAGHAEVAELLMRHGGDPSRESYDVETPLAVARQGPAEFLGVNTDKVRIVLAAPPGARELHSVRQAVQELVAAQAGSGNGLSAVRSLRFLPEFRSTAAPRRPSSHGQEIAAPERPGAAR